MKSIVCSYIEIYVYQVYSLEGAFVPSWKSNFACLYPVLYLSPVILFRLPLWLDACSTWSVSYFNILLLLVYFRMHVSRNTLRETISKDRYTRRERSIARISSFSLSGDCVSFPRRQRLELVRELRVLGL